MPTRAGTTRKFTVSLPARLGEQVERIAGKESRTISELFREAFQVYRASRIRELLTESLAEARKFGNNGYGPEDVERLVDEVRAEQWTKKRDKSPQLTNLQRDNVQ